MAESSSDSDSSYDEPKRKKARPGRKSSGVVVNGADGLFKCSCCGKQFSSKSGVYKHVRGNTCVKGIQLKCKWCNLDFTNSGNLATHAKNMHGDSRHFANMSVEETSNNIKNLKVCIENSKLVNQKCEELMKPPVSTKVLKSYKKFTTKQKIHKCHVCERVFSHKFKLCYHIRRIHFNLQAKIPHASLKKVNQVWFERVLNSNIVVEIKKTGQNTLVIRKLDENTNIKVCDTNTNIIDLTSVYPVERRIDEQRTYCDICKRSYMKRDYKKHVKEIHMKSVKHNCNNCNRSFKRSYQYLQHICNKVTRIKGVTHEKKNRNPADIRITSVESLSMPLG